MPDQMTRDTVKAKRNGQYIAQSARHGLPNIRQCRSTIFYFIVLSLLCLGSGFALSDSRFVFAGDPWPPFFISSDNQYLDGGAGYEVTKEIFDRVGGLLPIFPLVPWKRALTAVEHGSKDGIPFLIKNSHRESFMLFSVPVATASSRFFYKKERFPDGFQWSSPDDLKSLRVGIVSGYSYGEFMDELIAKKQLAFTEVNESFLGFKMLALGRIDLMVESTPVGIKIIEEQGWLDQAGWSDKIINADIYYIGVSKKSPVKRFLPQINEAIINATKDGTIDALLQPVGASSYPH